MSYHFTNIFWFLNNAFVTSNLARDNFDSLILKFLQNSFNKVDKFFSQL